MCWQGNVVTTLYTLQPHACLPPSAHPFQTQLLQSQPKNMRPSFMPIYFLPGHKFRQQLIFPKAFSHSSPSSMLSCVQFSIAKRPTVQSVCDTAGASRCDWLVAYTGRVKDTSALFFLIWNSYHTRTTYPILICSCVSWEITPWFVTLSSLEGARSRKSIFRST